MGVVFIGAGIISFARGGQEPRFIGLLLAMQAAVHLALFAGDFLSLSLGWGLLGLTLGLFVLHGRGTVHEEKADRGSLRRVAFWMVGVLGMLGGGAGLAFTWNVRPVCGPDIIQAQTEPGAATDPAKWPNKPVHTLEFPTLQRLALANLETHWTQKPIDEVMGLLSVQRLQQWEKDVTNPKGAALRRPQLPGLSKEQINQGIVLEQTRDVEALSKPPMGYGSQTGLFLILFGASWLAMGLPPFTGMWVQLVRNSPAPLALAVAGASLALAWDLLTRVAIPLAPLALVSQLSLGVLWIGAAGTFVIWNLASSQPKPQKALGMIAGIPIFALFTSIVPMFDTVSASSGWWWGASGVEYLGGAAVLSLALLLLGALHLGSDWKTFEGSWARSPRAVVALSLGLLAIAGLPGLAPFVGYFMAGLSMAGKHPLAMLIYFAGLAYGAWVALRWIGLMIKPAPPDPGQIETEKTEAATKVEPFPVSALVASFGLVLLLLAGGVYPTLVLNWMEPGATAKAERIRAAVSEGKSISLTK